MTRRAGRLVLAAGLAAGPVLLLGAASAAEPPSCDGQTAGYVQAPPTTTAAGTVPLSGTACTSIGRLELRLTPPGRTPGDGADAVLAAQDPQPPPRTLSFDLVTAPCSAPAPACAPKATAPNGTWTLRLVDTSGGGGEVAGGTFVLDVPAAAPTGVAATLRPDRTVVVRWDRGPEPDLLGWDVQDGGGRSRQVDLPQAAGAAGPCDDTGACSTTFAYRPVDGGTRSFTVRARRACGTSGCTPVASPASAAATVTLPPPAAGTGTPSPRPAASPARSGAAPALPRGFSAPAPFTAPRLPALPAPRVAAPQLPDGTFEPTLGYGDRTATDEPEPGEAAARPAVTRLTDTGAGLLQDAQLVQSVAGALVLALGGAHLRSWLGRSPAED